MLKSMIRTGCIAAAIALGAGQAHALNIKDLSLNVTGGSHDIHVKFDRTADNWTTATSKPVVFKLNSRLKVYSLNVIRPSSYLIHKVDGMDGIDGDGFHALDEPRTNPGVTYPYAVWEKSTTYSVPGNDMTLASAAVAACKNLHATGKNPDESHRVAVGSVKVRVEVSVDNYGVAFVKKDSKSADTTIFAVCEKDPDWTPPTRAGNPLEIAAFAVHPETDADVCPKPYELKVTFQARWAKTAKFRIRYNGGLSKLYTRELKKDGDKYTVRFTKSYTLDPGPATFQIEVRDGPNSEVITKQVTCPPFKVISTFLKYNHGNETYCAKQVRERVIFKTTRPGWVRYRIKHQGGLVVAEGKVTAKRVGDQYIAVARRLLTFNEDFEADMMAEVTTQTDANSGWQKLAVSCLKLSDPKIVMSDPENKSGEGQCPRKGRVRVKAIFNQPDKKVSLKVNCSNGFSKQFQATTRKNRVTGEYRIVRSFKFPVTKTEKVACSLIDMDNGKTLTFTGFEYPCIHRAVDLPQDDLTATPKQPAAAQPDVEIAPQPNQPTPVDDTPNCRVTWKKTCSVEPVKTCTKVVDRECKVVPTRRCQTKTTQSCKRVRVRDCQQVRGRTVCKAKWKNECTPKAQQVCGVERTKQCTPVVKDSCKVVMKKTCDRTPVRQCQN